MRPTLRQLQYLVAIAETGRFGDAARRVAVSQPSLSAQIADMEAELGVPLVERGRSGAVLTPMGEAIVRRARTILREVEDLRSLAIRGQGKLGGRFRLGVLPSIGPYLLPKATRTLHQRFPELRLAVREARTRTLDQALRDGEVDTIISTPGDHGDMPYIHLFREEMWISASPEDRLSTSTEAIRIDDLKNRPLLALGVGHRLSQIIADIARAAGGYVNAEYEGTSLDAIRQMSVMGAGIAVLPSLYAISEAQRDPEFLVRRLDHPTARRDIALIWRASSPLAERLSEIGECLRETATELMNQGQPRGGATESALT